MDQYNNYIGLLLDGRYKIKRLLGIGGMAMVFEADDIFRKIVRCDRPGTGDILVGG